ncbi:LuxR C-terminal-related transcriptional regulator [Streptomyces sp. NPDC051909]|uniref:helix-turn-helix transcriptional regulator n=1 Tax=Streptomyces sp. NPDC051909 TaxID=3154944 RepID=UPI003449ECF9
MERNPELEAFEVAWGRRSCQAIVIAGPAGVGKSRLAEECLARAVRGGFKGRRATATAAAATVPLGAIAHILPPGVDLSEPVKGFAEVARVLSGPQRDRKWAILIDDVHLLDATSAVLLRQLMITRLVRLIATLRTGEPATEAVQALCYGDEISRIDLDVFDLNQTMGMLQAILGGPVTRRTAHQLFTASGGNALYLRELVQGASAKGSFAFDGEIWQLVDSQEAVGTPRLSELVKERLGTADPRARLGLELLALCEPLPLADIQAAADDPHAVADLEAVGLVSVHRAHRRTNVTLAHPLYGEVLRSQLRPVRRREILLRQIDRAKEHGSRRREDVLRIAAWQLAATGTADSSMLSQAATLARYAHDYPQALALLEALRPEEYNTATRLMLGEVLFEVGRPEHAEKILQDAERHAAGESELLAITLTRTFNLFWAAGRTAEAFALNDAARLRMRDESEIRMLRYNEGSMWIATGHPDHGLELLEDLTNDLSVVSNPAAWLAGAMMKPVGLYMTGRISDAVTFAEDAHKAHLDVEDSALYPHPAVQLISVSAALRDFGRLAEARDVGESGFADLASASIPLPSMWMAVNLGELELLAGHPATARRWFAEAANRARRHHNARTLNPALNGIAVCAAQLGDLEAAKRALSEARNYPPLGIFIALECQALACLAAATGDLRRARRLLVDGATVARTARLIPPEMTLLVDVARLGGANQVAPRLAELAQDCDGPFAVARAHLAAGLAADSPGQLSNVAGELESIGADLLAAEAASAAAGAYERAGQVRKASAAARLANTCAGRCEGVRTPLLTAALSASLTAREREVALLAAQGTPSKEIAASFHLSVRTVDNHLQHAYTKLGVTTRRELAATLGTLGTP